MRSLDRDLLPPRTGVVDRHLRQAHLKDAVSVTGLCGLARDARGQADQAAQGATTTFLNIVSFRDRSGTLCCYPQGLRIQEPDVDRALICAREFCNHDHLVTVVEDVDPEICGMATEVTVASAGCRRQPVGRLLFVYRLIGLSSCWIRIFFLSCQSPPPGSLAIRGSLGIGYT